MGPMGAGKSTIGRQLAKSLSCAFRDIDQLVVEQAGADIPWIFDVEGEEGFRQRETSVLQAELACGDSSVIATGGGVIKQKVNRDLLKARSLVVYLYADVETQYERTLKDKNRPLLAVNDPKKKLTELMAIRAPLYKEVADIIEATHSKSVTDVVENILDHWQNIS